MHEHYAGALVASIFLNFIFLAIIVAASNGRRS